VKKKNISLKFLFSMVMMSMRYCTFHFHHYHGSFSRLHHEYLFLWENFLTAVRIRVAQFLYPIVSSILPFIILMVVDCNLL